LLLLLLLSSIIFASSLVLSHGAASMSTSAAATSAVSSTAAASAAAAVAPSNPKDALSPTVRQLLDRESASLANALLTTSVCASYLFWREDGLPFEAPPIDPAGYDIAAAANTGAGSFKSE
jgi:hypothetical protein